MSTSKTVVHMAGAVALLLGMDAYANREIRSLRAEITGTERSIAAEVAKARRAAVQPHRQAGPLAHIMTLAHWRQRWPAVLGPVQPFELARNSELAPGYSIGSAETRNLPGR